VNGAPARVFREKTDKVSGADDKDRGGNRAKGMRKTTGSSSVARVDEGGKTQGRLRSARWKIEAWRGKSYLPCQKKPTDTTSEGHGLVRKEVRVLQRSGNGGRPALRSKMAF